MAAHDTYTPVNLQRDGTSVLLAAGRERLAAGEVLEPSWWDAIDTLLAALIATLPHDRWPATRARTESARRQELLDALSPSTLPAYDACLQGDE